MFRKKMYRLKKNNLKLLEKLEKKEVFTEIVDTQYLTVETLSNNNITEKLCCLDITPE